MPALAPAPLEMLTALVRGMQGQIASAREGNLRGKDKRKLDRLERDVEKMEYEVLGLQADIERFMPRNSMPQRSSMR